MNINKFFPSPYLRTNDIPAQGIVLTVKGVEEEKFEQRAGKTVTKPMMAFQETSQKLILNRTNAKLMEKFTGTPETEEWVGRKIRLAVVEVEYGGDIVPAIRIKEVVG